MEHGRKVNRISSPHGQAAVTVRTQPVRVPGRRLVREPAVHVSAYVHAPLAFVQAKLIPPLLREELQPLLEKVGTHALQLRCL